MERLENRSENVADIDWLIQYVCAVGVRHPDFGDAVNRWRAEVGDPPLAGDDIQIARKLSLSTALAPIKQWRWRMAHSRPDDARFIISDLGWVYVGQPRMPGRGLHIPLTARLAVLAWADPANPGKVDHQDMRPCGIRWLNVASWEEAPEFVVGHPDDKAELERMTSAADVDKWGALTRGVYYGHEACRPGLFDDLWFGRRRRPARRWGNLILPLGGVYVFVAQVRS